jgi:ABC-type multidrug transport system fused ATPase/permease subunit
MAFMAPCSSCTSRSKPSPDNHGPSSGLGAERVFEILDEPPSIQDKPDAKIAPRFAKAIEFHEVSFAYGAKPVLSRINLTIRAGEVVALVGMSGAGKSTWPI